MLGEEDLARLGELMDDIEINFGKDGKPLNKEDPFTIKTPFEFDEDD